MKNHDSHEEPERLNLVFQLAKAEEELANQKRRTAEVLGDVTADVVRYIRESVHARAGYCLDQETLADIDEKLDALEETFLSKLSKK